MRIERQSEQHPRRTAAHRQAVAGDAAASREFHVSSGPVRVRIDKRLVRGLDDDYSPEEMDDDIGNENQVELEFGSQEEALAHLHGLATDWDTDLVPAKGYVDYDGGDYDDDPDGTTFLFNGPERDEERQGFATILRGAARVAGEVRGPDWKCPDCGGNHVIEPSYYTCPSCGYDEVTANNMATCPECGHQEDDWIDDRAEIDRWIDNQFENDPARYHRYQSDVEGIEDPTYAVPGEDDYRDKAYWDDLFSRMDDKGRVSRRQPSRGRRPFDRHAAGLSEWWPPAPFEEWQDSSDNLSGAIGDNPMYGGEDDRYREFLNDHVIELSDDELTGEWRRMSADPAFGDSPLGQVMQNELQSREESQWESRHEFKQAALAGADHEFAPDSDRPDRCDSCGGNIVLVPGEVLRDLRSRGVFGRRASKDPVDEFVRWCSGMNDGKVDERALARFMDEYPGLSQSQFGDELRDFVRGQ